jgi:hypothetical protein
VAARSRRQLSLSAFYPPQSLADAQAQLEEELAAQRLRPVEHWISSFPSPALDELLHELRSPRAIAAWMRALPARVIEVPGNGGCLHFSVYCCRTRYALVGNSISAKASATKATKHVKEANFYKNGMCERFVQYLDAMISDGTVTVADLTQRYFGTGLTSHRKVDRQAAIQAIIEFIRAVAKKSLFNGLTKSQWAGDAELFSTVWFVREPLFILGVAADGSTTVRVIWLTRMYPDGPERILQLHPEAGEAYEMLRTFLRHRVLPMVLVYSSHGGDGHFNSLRFDDQLYTAWTADDVTGQKMRQRMDQALETLGWYVAPHEATGIPKTLNIRVESSGSEYTPSQPGLLSDSSLPASPDAPLPPTAHYSLLQALDPRRRRRSTLATLWDQAERLNLRAYQEWDANQECSDTRDEPDTVNSGCVYWGTQICKLVDLLRALPYPEVAMSLLPAALFTRLGNELNDLVDRGSVPEFIRAEDPVEARRHWIRLVALVVVISDDDLTDLRSLRWLRQHPTEVMAALHSLRLFDWTVVARLVQAINSTHSTHSSASGLTGGARL